MGVVWALMLTIVVGTSAGLVASEPTPVGIDQAALIFANVMSPYCPGRTLATCGASAAEELRTDVKRQLASGLSVADVEEGLYRRFGDSIRAVPRTSGVGLLAWVMPFVALIASVVWLLTWLLRHTGASAARDVEGDIPVELATRLDEELANL